MMGHRNEMEGETMENKLTELYAKREAALKAGDATAYNAADAEMQAVIAYMRAEVRLGLRDDPIFSVSVSA